MSVVRSRLKGRMDPLALEFTSSIEQDRKIFHYDILVDIAHVLCLLKCGHIDVKDAKEIIRALLEVRDAGYDALPKDCEDVHEAIEKAVTTITPSGKKMHTARSRNDEVVTCLRMFARDKLLSLAFSILELRKVLLNIAERHVDTIMPGFTHLQYAQPTVLSHWMLAYHDMLERDFRRVLEAFGRVNKSPLGSAAFAGTSFELDRHYTAELLGFDGVVENSCDAVSSRDFLIESIFVASMCFLTLSRMAEEIVLWSSEFGFIELPDEYASSSSIMPQKKNPDVAELIRAKAGRVLGELAGAMAIYKAMPMSYNRDFQEMNSVMFETLETTDVATILMARMLESIEFRVEIMLEKALKGFANATEIADLLAKKGIPFRDAHRIVGRIVAEAELSADAIVKVAREFGYDIKLDENDLNIDARDIVENRKNIGGTSRSEIMRMIEDRLNTLERDRELLSKIADTLSRKIERLYEEAMAILKGTS